MINENTEELTINAKVKATDRYKKYLEISSLFMKEPLTSLEMKILDEFYHASDGVITTESRRTVRENMNISSENLNNYIRTLRLKKVIVDDKINSRLLILIPNEETFTINLKLKVML